MNKSEMKKIMKEPFSEIMKTIKDKDINKELKAVNDLLSVCEDLRCLAEKRRQTIIDDKLCCKCGHYFKPNPKKQFTTKRIVTSPTYWYSDYGDDDGYADFEITELYENCPKCKKPVTVKLAFFERQIPGTERDRWGKVYS